MNGIRALVDVAAGMVEAVSAEDRLARALADQLVDQFPGGVSVWLRRAGDGPLRLEVDGHPPDLLARLTGLVTDASGLPRPALAAGRTVLIADADADADAGADADPMGGRGCLLPMSANGHVLGVVAATLSPGDAMPDEWTLALATALADIAAVTLANARVLADATAVAENLRRQVEVLDGVSDAIVALDAERRVVSWNTGAERMYRYTRAEALGRDLFALVATEFCTSDGLPLELAEVLRTAAETGGWRGELRERRVDGVPLTALCSLNVITGDDGVPRGTVLINRDVTEQRHEEYRALHDELTGLPNGRLLTNRLYDGVARARRDGTSLAVLFVDLQQFRLINDVYGQAAGNEVLRHTAARLLTVVRGNDAVSRLQGDAFVVVLENAGSEESVRLVAERIAQATAEPVGAGGDVIVVQATIGAVLVLGTEGQDSTPDDLIKMANNVRHMAKAAGDTFALEYLQSVDA